MKMYVRVFVSALLTLSVRESVREIRECCEMRETGPKSNNCVPQASSLLTLRHLLLGRVVEEGVLAQDEPSGIS